MLFRTTSRRQKMFHDALARETKKTKKRTDRGENFRAHFPYGITLLWVLFVGVGVYCALFSPLLLINQFDIQNNQDLSISEIRSVVETTLDTKRWFVFPARNFFVLPTRVIEQQIKALSPLVEQVRVTRTFPETVHIVLRERSELVYWCAGGPCVLVNAQGEAWAHANGFDTRYDEQRFAIVDTSALPVTLGQALPVQDYLQYFLQFTRISARELGVEIAHQATTPSRYSRELRLVTAEGWVLLVNIDIPLDETVLGLKSFLGEQGQQQNNSRLTVVDARVPGRIFVTNQAQTVESTSSDTQATHSKE